MMKEIKYKYDKEETQKLIDRIGEINRKVKRIGLVEGFVDKFDDGWGVSIFLIDNMEEHYAERIQQMDERYNNKQANIASHHILYFLWKEAEENGWIDKEEAEYLKHIHFSDVEDEKEK